MHYANIREEELKNKVAQDYFWLLDCTQIIGNVDFCVSLHNSKPELDIPPLLWAEAKKGMADIQKSISQLILTIGKARTFDKSLPPAFLGAFDAEKIAFVPYSEISDVFYQNDFNWKVTPSNHDTREFKLIHTKVQHTLDEQALIFYFGKDDKELHYFIKHNFIAGKYGINKTRIDKNNFMVIYNKWLTAVKPTIQADWELAKKAGIIDGDFYLADLLSEENTTLKDKLFVLLKTDTYHLDRKLNESGMFVTTSTGFTDKQKAHNQFWNIYERPPKEEYWDYIIGRRDLLVPQDVRERKGSFFTPQIWVELSQKYLADTLGEDWQDEYYIWDCAAGTGNLLAGLTNKNNIFASTLDKQDVDVMHDRIRNGANLWENQVFQFDFLNDSFDKLPKNLKNIIDDPEKRKKLVIYINPPYAESNGKTSITRSNVQVSKIHTKYSPKLEKVSAELFAQFLVRIYFEIPDCIIGQFSTLKLLNGTNSKVFRNNFLAKLKKCFIVPADTFDNVNGSFPIGFFIWDTKIKEKIEENKVDVYNSNAIFLEKKSFYSYDNEKGKINDWLNLFKKDKNDTQIGFLMADAPDFQNNNLIAILNEKGNRHGIFFAINQQNLIIASIYITARKIFEHTWINHNDQFLFPNDNWKTDFEFQNDCLSFALFQDKNRITAKDGTNHFIPFTEQEINAQERFESSFMTDFIKGKLKQNTTSDVFGNVTKARTTPLEFSAEAKIVFDAGRELWKYYHKSINHINTSLNKKPNANASLYDIREYFQGRGEKGRMNTKSEDEIYTKLVADLRETLKVLAKKIEVKVYEYGFLKG